MLGLTYGTVSNGVISEIIRVEAEVTRGFPRFVVAGLPDSAVSEAKIRVRSAIRNSGFTFPQCRVVVNLSPANVRKRGTTLDLSIALAILVASEQIRPIPERTACVAELDLSGALRTAQGILGGIKALRDANWECIVVPERSHPVLDELASLSVVQRSAELRHTVEALAGNSPYASTSAEVTEHAISPDETDTLTALSPNQSAGRSLLLAVTGRHHSLLIGPPGVGKTQMAMDAHLLLPDLTLDEALEVSRLHELETEQRDVRRPPLRRPHHAATVHSLLGGGSPIRPGELSLAHGGLLLFDEVLEFSRTSLQALRQPLVDGLVELSSHKEHITLPADFLFLGTTNPCPCGSRGFKECLCAEQEVVRYWSKLRGPLLDRIEIVAAVEPSAGTTARVQPTITELRRQIRSGRAILEECSSSRKTLASLLPFLTQGGSRRFRNVQSIPGISHRALLHILRLSLTIAALEGRIEIDSTHIEEAASHRPLN